MTARQHHYVPQFYLKGFAKVRKKPRLYCVDLKTRTSFETAPENVAVERDFNRIDIKGFDIDAFEKLSAEEETGMAEALARILERRSIADPADRESLFYLISILSTKNPPMRRNMQSFHDHLSRVVMDLATATKERWEHQVKKATDAGYLDCGGTVTYEWIRALVEEDRIKMVLRNEEHLRREVEMLQTVYPLISARKWMLLKAPRGSPGFITSDHPASLMWSDPTQRGSPYSPGHGLKGTQLLFPVSRELAMLGSFDVDEEEMEADETLIAMVNGSTLLHASRQVYGSGSRLWLPSETEHTDEGRRRAAVRGLSASASPEKVTSSAVMPSAFAAEGNGT